MLNIAVHIFQHLISSMYVSDVYGFMRCNLCLIFILPLCNEAVSLVQHYVITNGPLYEVSILYAGLLTSMTLSPTF